MPEPVRIGFLVATLLDQVSCPRCGEEGYLECQVDVDQTELVACGLCDGEGWVPHILVCAKADAGDPDCEAVLSGDHPDDLPSDVTPEEERDMVSTVVCGHCAALLRGTRCPEVGNWRGTS